MRAMPAFTAEPIAQECGVLADGVFCQAGRLVRTHAALRSGVGLGVALIAFSLPAAMEQKAFAAGSAVSGDAATVQTGAQPGAQAGEKAGTQTVGEAGAQTGAEGTPVAPKDAPFITPSVDADVLYEITSPTGDAVAKQRMRWQVGTLRQRLDPQGSDLFMITSWRDHTLTVVDPDRKKKNVMPAPSQDLTPPGHPAMVGAYARLGGSVVAGEHCIIWRTRDADGHASDVCYTADGLLLQVAQKGQITVRALHVSRVAQPDAVFAIPAGLSKEAPARP